MSNYPAGIRQYDNDPRSPFYEGEEPDTTTCHGCEEEFTEDVEMIECDTGLDCIYYCEDCYDELEHEFRQEFK